MPKPSDLDAGRYTIVAITVSHRLVRRAVRLTNGKGRIDREGLSGEPVPVVGMATHGQLVRLVLDTDASTLEIRFGVDPDAEAFLVDAECEADDVEVVLARENLAALDAEQAQSLFSMDYLGDMSKAVTTSEQVTIELGTEFPTKMHFSG